jgi:glyoxylase-like metal-dependent hydrolase (beta-lactamase superfamily II)
MVVGHSPDQAAAFFEIHSWPDQIAAYDLGGRVLDRRTHLLLTGDELYPGRLYVPTGEFATYRRSIDRIVNFTRSRSVSWVLGCHIEMTRKPGRGLAQNGRSTAARCAP